MRRTLFGGSLPLPPDGLAVDCKRAREGLHEPEKSLSESHR